jgi:ubiquinone/menaquinone biosynthesis C-methylase UbiE
LLNKKPKKQSITNIEFKVADAYELGYPDNSFDVILLFNTIHIVQEPVSVLKKIYNLLKPDGVLVMATDCYAEPLSGGIRVLVSIQKILKRLGIISFLHFYKKTEIDIMLTNIGYEIIERDDLNENPVNYYVALSKQSIKK